MIKEVGMSFELYELELDLIYEERFIVCIFIYWLYVFIVYKVLFGGNSFINSIS